MWRRHMENECVYQRRRREKKQSGRRMKERMKNPQPNEQRGE